MITLQEIWETNVLFQIVFSPESSYIFGISRQDILFRSRPHKKVYC